jgi:hypothetical protein
MDRDARDDDLAGNFRLRLWIPGSFAFRERPGMTSENIAPAVITK